MPFCLESSFFSKPFTLPLNIERSFSPIPAPRVSAYEIVMNTLLAEEYGDAYIHIRMSFGCVIIIENLCTQHIPEIIALRIASWEVIFNHIPGMCQGSQKALLFVCIPFNSPIQLQIWFSTTGNKQNWQIPWCQVWLQN